MGIGVQTSSNNFLSWWCLCMLVWGMDNSERRKVFKRTDVGVSSESEHVYARQESYCVKFPGHRTSPNPPGHRSQSRGGSSRPRGMLEYLVALWSIWKTHQETLPRVSRTVAPLVEYLPPMYLNFIVTIKIRRPCNTQVFRKHPTGPSDWE